MSAPMPSVPSTTGLGRAGGAGVADGVVHVRPRVVGDGAGQGVGRGGRSGRAASRRRRGAASRSPAPTSSAPSATWMCTPTPRSAARPAAASSVSSVQVNAACTPTQPAAAGPQEPLVLGQPGRGAVGPVAVGDAVGSTRTRTPTSAQASAITSRLPSMALGDSWWSTIAVRAALERLERAEHGRPADHLEVERDVEPPPDLLEDLEEARRRAAAAPACPGPAPSRGGGGRRPGPACRPSRRPVVASVVGVGRRRGRIGSAVRHSPSSVVQRGGHRAARWARGRSRRRP